MRRRPCVTPCVGVWIETSCTDNTLYLQLSHPAWVCGLKLYLEHNKDLQNVTPCVGVWIETCSPLAASVELCVTPCVGVWIETLQSPQLSILHLVTPCVGVWIETRLYIIERDTKVCVTPCVGVWIETPVCKDLFG